MDKNEQNEKIKWAKIFVQTLINIRTACMESFDHRILLFHYFVHFSLYKLSPPMMMIGVDG